MISQSEGGGGVPEGVAAEVIEVGQQVTVGKISDILTPHRNADDVVGGKGKGLKEVVKVGEISPGVDMESIASGSIPDGEPTPSEAITSDVLHAPTGTRGVRSERPFSSSLGGGRFQSSAAGGGALGVRAAEESGKWHGTEARRLISGEEANQASPICAQEEVGDRAGQSGDQVSVSYGPFGSRGHDEACFADRWKPRERCGGELA
ncbi:hypothetical protein COCNU_scaffold004276G000040 [Cocos nucifera]|nr:hypothetical protein [Cocos nucifera]